MAKSKSKAGKGATSRHQAYLQEKKLEQKRRENAILSVIFFCIVAAIVLPIQVMCFDTTVVSACLLMIIEVGLAVVLHHSELWQHGALLAVEVIVGAVMSKLAIVALCIVIYVAATIALKYIYTGVKK